ncbi:hypothetical protein [Mesorhizobium sp. M0058]|uniref:hypothetical protein n=1 Tax=Mesorhizobium sp. M0058 TaxID=2956865 RepID=UPI0033380665
MASSRLRSFILMAFGSIAVALAITAFMAPPSIGTHDPGLYAAPSYQVSFMVPDLAVTPDHVAIKREEAPAPHAVRSAPLLSPVYAMSLQTDGQSLYRYHLRC